LEALIDVSLVLKENGFDTCYPIRKSDGSFILLYPSKSGSITSTATSATLSTESKSAAPPSGASEPHRVILFEFLRGRNPVRPTPIILSAVGRTLAELHSIPLHKYDQITKKLPEFPMGYIQMIPFCTSPETSQPNRPFHSHELVKLFRSQCFAADQ
jgi:hypothetical protein